MNRVMHSYILTLLLASLGFSKPAHAFDDPLFYPSQRHVAPRYLSTCKTILTKNTELPIPFGATQTKRDTIKRLSGLVPQHSLDRINSFFNSLSRNQRSNFTPAFSDTVTEDLARLLNERDSIHLLFPSSYSIGAKIDTLLQHFNVALDEATPLRNRASYFVRSIQNEHQASYIYELLIKTVYGRERKLIERILDESPYFKGAIRQEEDSALIITSSFEKETHSVDVTDFYKSSRYSDEEWFRFSPIERKDKLTYVLRNGTLLVSKTEKAPRHLGKLTYEVMDHPQKYMLELKSSSYNLLNESTFKQASELALHLNEWHSFHFHHVFHAPLNSETYYNAFIGWFERLNSYAYFSGLEERLIPGRLTKNVDWNYVKPGNGITTLDKLLNQFEVPMKLHGVGLRSGIYGDRLIRDHIKLGIELRDVSRNSEKLKEIMDGVATALAKRIWFKIDFSHPNLFRLSEVLSSVSYSDVPKKNLLNILQDQEITDKLIKIEPQIYIPLVEYENAIFTLTNEAYSPLSAAKISKIKKARFEYSVGLQKLTSDLLELKKSTGITEGDWEAATSVIRWELADWAAKAKISELLKPF